MTKWLVLIAWVGSILFAHFRGRVRLPLGRQMLDHSILLAPVNAFMVLTSRVPTTPYLPLSTFPDLQLLADNLVALEVVDSISHETVRKTLKKTV